MRLKRILAISILGTLMAVCAVAPAATLSFSGYTWTIRPSGIGGPGPNHWDPDNVWVDTNGWLHLKLAQRGGKWQCSEVFTQNRLGFGRYQFWLGGPVDKLDPNVVFGLFNYPTSDVGPDATHEIDIEFAKWGDSRAPIGNYTLWPTANTLTRVTHSFPLSLEGDLSTHRFTWSAQSVHFQSLQGHLDDNSREIASWRLEPEDPAARISRKPMPVHINLWCFKGQPPTNGREVELIVRAFKFTPMAETTSK